MKLIDLPGLVLIASILFIDSATAQASIKQGFLATVGQDDACLYNTNEGDTIQQAINDGASDIRVVNGVYFEGIALGGASQTLSGGFANCSDALSGITDGNHVVLDTTGLQKNPIHIQQTDPAQARSIYLNNLSLTGSQPSSTFNGGGMVISGNRLFIEMNNVIINDNISDDLGGGLLVNTTNSRIDIKNSTIENNEGRYGGGVAITGDHVNVLLTDTLINDNSAILSGGGLYCDGDHEVKMSSTRNVSNGLINNKAEGGDGGGAFIDKQCQLESNLGRLMGDNQQASPSLTAQFEMRGSIDTGIYKGIINNTASGHGGGVALFDGAKFILDGNPNCDSGECFPASMLGNRASITEGRGGAIFASDNSQVILDSVDISFNQALDGGALALDDGVYAEISRSVSQPCWSAYHCNQIKGNVAFNKGGAIWVKDASMKSEYVHYSNNTAGLGVVASVTGDGIVHFDTSLMHRNGLHPVFPNNINRYLIANTDQSGSVMINQSTIADNDLDDQFSIVLLNNGGVLDVFNSVIHEPDDVRFLFVGSDIGTTFDCVMVHEKASIPEGRGFRVSVNDPQFIDRDSGDYHLNSSSSPAIDYCDPVFENSLSRDIDLQSRGADNPMIDNFQGVHDLGFDESGGVVDLIFQDGFE